MPATVTLNQSAVCTLDSNGNGQAQLGPRNLRETWQPGVVSVGTSQETITSEAQAKVYAGEDTSQPNYADGTLSGSTGDSTTNLPQTLTCGQYIFAVWTGGDPGAPAYVRVTGTKQIA